MSNPFNHPLPSYLQADNLGPWGNYLQQVDRVIPYLGNLARWAETLKRPKRALIVDVPIQLDNGTSRTLRVTAYSTTPRADPAKAACVFTRT